MCELNTGGAATARRVDGDAGGLLIWGSKALGCCLTSLQSLQVLPEPIEQDGGSSSLLPPSPTPKPHKQGSIVDRMFRAFSMERHPVSLRSTRHCLPAAMPLSTQLHIRANMKAAMDTQCVASRAAAQGLAQLPACMQRQPGPSLTSCSALKAHSDSLGCVLSCMTGLGLTYVWPHLQQKAA